MDPSRDPWFLDHAPRLITTNTLRPRWTALVEKVERWRGDWKFPFWAYKQSHTIHGTGIFTYIYHQNQPTVGKYTIHELYGNGFQLKGSMCGIYIYIYTIKPTEKKKTFIEDVFLWRSATWSGIPFYPSQQHFECPLIWGDQRLRLLHFLIVCRSCPSRSVKPPARTGKPCHEHHVYQNRSHVSNGLRIVLMYCYVYIMFLLRMSSST